ncbi:MAG: guanylate kinase [Gammaproteobacteria bacterium]|nr:guanylate kinase [Gammaproteobacteria bacterium]NNJ85448.1 guanylate kinase [Gammaproteobacteria bacterium]
MKYPGTLYVISAPSGAGKTSLVRALVADDPRVLLSISHTTRLPRPGEQDGVHYHFVSKSAFQAIRERNAFLECAHVFGNDYGTSREWLTEKLCHGVDIILEIDWQGARQVRKEVSGCMGIFVLPPSRDALTQRLLDRGQDDESVIAERMQKAESELSHFDEFDYLIVNDDFDTALSDLRAIFQAERLRQFRQALRYRSLLNSLLE